MPGNGDRFGFVFPRREFRKAFEYAEAEEVLLVLVLVFPELEEMVFPLAVLPPPPVPARPRPNGKLCRPAAPLAAAKPCPAPPVPRNPNVATFNPPPPPPVRPLELELDDGWAGRWMLRLRLGLMFWSWLTRKLWASWWWYWAVATASAAAAVGEEEDDEDWWWCPPSGLWFRFRLRDRWWFWW